MAFTRLLSGCVFALLFCVVVANDLLWFWDLVAVLVLCFGFIWLGGFECLFWWHINVAGGVV